MREAFSYMFKDNMIKQKAGIYLVILFISSLLTNYANYMINKNMVKSPSIETIILSLAGFVISLITTGYCVNCIKTIVEQRENIILPFVNIKNNLFLGFKYYISLSLLGLIMTIVLVSSFFLSKEVAFILTCITFIILMLYIMPFMYIFATTGMWSSFLRFKRATIMIAKSKWQYWKNFLICFGIFILFGIISAVAYKETGIANVIAGTLIMAIASTYFMYVTSYLTAKAIKTDA